jgi:hypothetical protein
MVMGVGLLMRSVVTVLGASHDRERRVGEPPGAAPQESGTGGEFLPLTALEIVRRGAAGWSARDQRAVGE